MTAPLTMFDLQREMRQETENVVNRLHRHCRIGRVWRKMQIHGGKWVPMPGWMPDPVKPAPTPMFMDKCGCRVGSACGNAACPHAMTSTCAA